MILITFILILFILYNIFKKYSWEVFLNACEQLKYINNYGEFLQNNIGFNLVFEDKISCKKYYTNIWYHPIFEDLDRTATLILRNQKNSLFDKEILNLNLNFLKKKDIKKLSFYFNKIQAQIILSEKDYKLFDKNYKELYNLKNLNYNTPLFYNIFFIDPYFLTDDWNNIIPVSHGIKSCAN